MYLNRCMTASSSEDVGLPRATVPFSLESAPLKLGGGRYMGLIMSSTLAELVSGRCSSGGSRIRGGGRCDSGSGGGSSGRSGVGNGGGRNRGRGSRAG